MKISIIIPAYNEEERIGKTLTEHSKYFEALRKKNILDYEIIVVINNTTDNTESIVKRHQTLNNRISYLNLKQGGKGYAIIEGFKEAMKTNSDLIGFVDADLATPPEAFYNLIENIKNNDGIIASRYLKESKIIPKRTLKRTIIGKTFNLIVRALFLIPYRDTQCGAKLFNRVAAKKIIESVKTSQWAFDVEALYTLHKNKFKIQESPTLWREVEGSKINIQKTSLQMFLSITQLRINNSYLKRILNPLKPIIGIIWNKVK